MDSSSLQMILVGILFGIWPILMRHSNLSGTTSAAAFCTFSLMVVFPFALKSGINVSGTKWWLGVAAGLVAGAALLIFNVGLVKAPPAKVGTLVIIMIIVQTIVPATYQSFTGGLTIKTAMGFAAAIVATILLV